MCVVCPDGFCGRTEEYCPLGEMKRLKRLSYDIISSCLRLLCTWVLSREGCNTHHTRKNKDIMSWRSRQEERRGGVCKVAMNVIIAVGRKKNEEVLVGV